MSFFPQPLGSFFGRIFGFLEATLAFGKPFHLLEATSPSWKLFSPFSAVMISRDVFCLLYKNTANTNSIYPGLGGFGLKDEGLGFLGLGFRVMPM